MNRTNAVASTGQSAASLAALLVRVGVEMEDASMSLQAVQHTLADVLPGGLSPQGIIGLQALDLVEQTVRALANVVLSMSIAVPSELEVDQATVLADCELSALAQRLARASVLWAPPIDESPRQRSQSIPKAGSALLGGTTHPTQDVELF